MDRREPSLATAKERSSRSIKISASSRRRSLAISPTRGLSLYDIILSLGNFRRARRGLVGGNDVLNCARVLF
jgi:hypothetical protein